MHGGEIEMELPRPLQTNLTNEQILAALAHYLRRDNPHEVTAEQIGAPTTEQFNALSSSVGNIRKELTLTAIPNDDDLDNYQSTGVWYVVSSAAAATIKNTPFTDGAFRVEVKTITTGRLVQIIYPNTDKTRFYMRNLSGSGWSEWQRFNGASADATVYGAAIPLDANLDDYKTVGDYFIGSTEIAASLTGTPNDGSTVTAHLEVKGLNVNTNTRLVQIYTPNWATSTQLGLYYMRQLISSGWTAWYKFEGVQV